MKRFMKGCAVTALIFACLGSILAFTGSSVAGRTTISQVAESVTRGRVHFNSGKWWDWRFWLGGSTTNAEFAEIPEMLEPVDADYDTDYGYEVDEPVEFVEEYKITKGDVDRFCPGEHIRKLELELGGCVLYCEYSDNEYLYLEAENAYKFHSYLKGNTLHVKAEGKSAENWADMGDCQITLYVPGDYRFDEVEVNLGAGYVVFGDLFANEASFEVGAGEIDISYAEVAEMDISVGAGSVVIGYMDVDQLEAEIGMGSFQTTGGLNRKADIECSMGDVAMYLDGKESDFNYQLEGSMGNIEIGGSGFSGFGQERKIDNGASKDIEVECSMGNISILFLD